MTAASGGVLLVHAHPDDESMATAGTMARLVGDGVKVDLVTCTDGAEGEIHDPSLDPEEARPRLAQIRAEELRCSVAAIGNGAVTQHLLGYRDSGMMGTDSNGHPDCFWQADLDEATSRLLAIVREVRPAVIVTYDENGNYGHPDHINAARIARDAYRSSAGEAWEVGRFYEIAFAREPWFALMTEMKERGIKLPWDWEEEVAHGDNPPDELNPTNVAAVNQVADEMSDGASAEQVEWGRPEDEVTTRVDVSAYLARKRASMECHRTQRQDLGWMLELPSDLADRVMSTEHFVLKWRDGNDVPSTYREEWIR